MTNPELSDLVARSRANQTNQPLETPADAPVVFSCKVNNHPAIACIYPSGIVCVIPDSLEHENIQLFSSLYWLEQSPRISDFSWDWEVSRLTK